MSNKRKEDTSVEEELDKLGSQLNEVYHNTINLALQAQGDLRFNISNKENKCSYDNLLCYLALREYDLSDLQLRLADHGLSSLEMLESHVLVSIERILKHFNISPANTSILLCNPCTLPGQCRNKFPELYRLPYCNHNNQYGA